MKHYLFVHFRETTSPEGEQVYFALSRDGFHWEALNDGNPILWAYYGDHGVRDMTILRDRHTGLFHIFATDLSLSYGMRGKYHHVWENIRRHGSSALAHWTSSDLVHWSEEELVELGKGQFGCLWAPDIIEDRERGDYLLHWSSSTVSDDFGPMAIYGCHTKDFVTYSEPQLIYRRSESAVIDSTMVAEGGRYYLFVKSERNPEGILLLVGDRADGPFTPVEGFGNSSLSIESGMYEAPTTLRTEDGRVCLFLDYYGVRGAGQGYVPFVADSLAKANFVRSDAAFSFPYGFKHGTILEITGEEYDRMRAHDWKDVPDNR